MEIQIEETDYPRKPDVYYWMIAKLKKRIRDTERLLQRVNLPRDVQLTHERSLKVSKEQLEKLQLEKRQKKVSKKYIMVKFFERQKALRALHKSIRDKSDDIESKALNVLYTIHYPPGEKYISLFKSTEGRSKEKQINIIDKLKLEFGPSLANLTEADDVLSLKSQVEKTIDDDQTEIKALQDIENDHLLAL